MWIQRCLMFGSATRGLLACVAWIPSPLQALETASMSEGARIRGHSQAASVYEARQKKYDNVAHLTDYMLIEEIDRAVEIAQAEAFPTLWPKLHVALSKAVV